MNNLLKTDVRIVSEEAATLTKNLLHEIQSVNSKAEESSPAWISNMVDILRFCVEAGEGLGIGAVYTLYLIKEGWDKLPLEFRKQYDFQFNILVYRETNIKPETLDNKFRAVKTYIVEGKRPFGTVEIPKRDQFNNPVIVDGEIVTEQFEWDVTKVPMTKLQVMRPLVERNEITSNQWAMLADPGIKVSQLHSEIYRREKPSDPDPSLMFKLYGDVIVAQEFGQEAVVGRLDFSQYGDNELVTNAIKHLMRCLSIKMDEEVITLIKENGFLERYQKEGDNEAKDESEGESGESIQL